MSDFRKHLNEKLKDEEFKKEWDNLELRYAVIKQLIKIRNSYNLTQAQLAEKLNTTQAVISRIESGTVNVGIDFLDKLAKAFNKRVEIKIL
ncbi:DNA-binding protein, putative [hydrothermal vent metagenome]|uniref:DNA-binding protein, putative n=1 Tax=hydrothermal vent metagenome TaxID=652676 RepID=A0A1W1BRG6_9ZZZZ